LDITSQPACGRSGKVSGKNCGNFGKGGLEVDDAVDGYSLGVSLKCGRFGKRIIDYWGRLLGGGIITIIFRLQTFGHGLSNTGVTTVGQNRN
jgi:hypothetical protein